MKKQSGFTLIELVMVIVILGILAAVALPKFVDLRDEASTAATKGVAGGISSAAATNYAAWAASSGAKGVTVDSATACTNAVVNTVLASPLLADYSVSGALDCAASAAGVSAVCSIAGPNSTSGSATMICVHS